MIKQSSWFYNLKNYMWASFHKHLAMKHMNKNKFKRIQAYNDMIILLVNAFETMVNTMYLTPKWNSNYWQYFSGVYAGFKAWIIHSEKKINILNISRSASGIPTGYPDGIPMTGFFSRIAGLMRDGIEPPVRDPD